MGSTHAAVAAHITAAIQNIVGGLLGWWVMVKVQIITPWCGTWHETNLNNCCALTSCCLRPPVMLGGAPPCFQINV